MDESPVLKVSPSDETILSWANQDFISPNLQNELCKANVLITPRSQYGDIELWHFPQGTEQVLHFLKNSTADGLNVDICIEDEDYKELILHADVLTLPDFILLFIIAPTFTGLLVEYIKTKLGSRQSETDLRTKITVVDEENKQSITLSYEGKAADFDRTVGKTLRLIDSSKRLSQISRMADLDYEERIRRLTDTTDDTR